jgi:hypothetical protein
MKADGPLALLAHDLTRLLNERVGRIRFLDDQHVKGGEGGGDSHIHIEGRCVARQDKKGRRWLLEVISRIRIGPVGQPETLTRPARFFLDMERHPKAATPPATPDAKAAAAPAGPDGKAGPPPLKAKNYGKLLERVYFSITTELYEQIRQDVAHKIDLLPTDYFRTVALLCEAKDYARSNTLFAYQQASELYHQAALLLDPTLRPLPTSWLRWPVIAGRYLRLAWRWLKRKGSRLWPRLGRLEVLCARAEVNYANMLIYQYLLANLFSRNARAPFEARRSVRSGLARLESLSRDVPGRQENLYRARVTAALVFSRLTEVHEARLQLDQARALNPFESDQDANHLFVSGLLEPDLRTSLRLLRRAVELAPRFEIAQFFLAYNAEMEWRDAWGLDRHLARCVRKEYETVLELNPSNVGAGGNLGYVLWLLAGQEGSPDGKPHRADRDLRAARKTFREALDAKDIWPETIVSELDYGLARIAAERGRLEEAHQHYVDALSARLTYSDLDYNSYYFQRFGQAMQQRFDRYRTAVEQNCDRARDDPSPPSHDIVLAVRAFALNDYGEACQAFYQRTGDEVYLRKAEQAFRHAIESRGYASVFAYLNLYYLYKSDGDGVLGSPPGGWDVQVSELEPRWAAGRQLRFEYYARKYRQDTQKAQELRAQAQALLPRARPGQREAAGRPDGALDEVIGPETDKDTLAKRAGQIQDLEARAALEQQKAENAADTVNQNVHALLPHDWLWTRDSHGGHEQFNFAAVANNAFRQERKWEKELDSTQVSVLLQWAWYRLYLLDLAAPAAAKDPTAGARPGESPTAEEINKLLSLLSHLQRSFAPEDLGVLRGRYQYCHRESDRGAIVAVIREVVGDALIERPHPSEALELARALWAEAEKPDATSEEHRKKRWEEARQVWEWAKQVDNGKLYRPHLPSVYYDARVVRACLSGNEPQAARESLESILSEKRTTTHVIEMLLTAADLAPDPQRDRKRGPWVGELLTCADRDEQCFRRLRGWLDAEMGAARGPRRNDLQRATLRLVRARFANDPVLKAPQEEYRIHLQLDSQLVLTPEREELAKQALIGHSLPRTRQRIVDAMGVTIPAIRVSVTPLDERLARNAYELRLSELPQTWGVVEPGQSFCPDLLAGRLGLADVPRKAAYNPRTRQEDGFWTDPETAKRVEAAGVVPWDEFEYMTRHLEAVLLDNLDSFLGVQEASALRDGWLKGAEVNLPAEPHTLARLARLLRGLVQEGVPLRNGAAILGALDGHDGEDVSALVEAAREQMKADLPGNDATRTPLHFADAFEEELARGRRGAGGKVVHGLPCQAADRLLAALAGALEARRSARLVLIVRRDGLRPLVRRLLERLDRRLWPDVVVLSAREQLPGLRVNAEVIPYER